MKKKETLLFQILNSPNDEIEIEEKYINGELKEIKANGILIYEN